MFSNGQEQKASSDAALSAPPVPGDWPAQGGEGFLGGEVRSMSLAQRRGMVNREHPKLSTARQCALLGVARSSLYYRPKVVSEEDLSLMGEIDRQYLETPFYGSRRLKAWLERRGIQVSRKRVQRLMRIMGLRAIYRRPDASRSAPERRVYPYLLREHQDHPAQRGVGRRHHLLAHGPVSRASTKHASGAEQKCTTREVIGQRKCPGQLFEEKCHRGRLAAGW